MNKWKNIIQRKNPIEILSGLFVLFYFISFVLYALKLFQFKWVALSYQTGDLLYHPWTLLTYSFFHAGFIALLFNLILLFYFGSVFLDNFSYKKFWQIFLSGVILGGLTFLISYIKLPDFYVQKGALLGASAGIMSIITYVSLNFPNYPLRIRFLGYIKLKYIFIFFLVFNLLQIPLGNPGGYFAHLGGVLAGLIWIGIEKISKTKKIDNNDIFSEENGKNYKLNKILEKINSSGYDSLTNEEKDYLFRQGQ
jgi:membrane associated rhomboid family serine protease